MLPTLFLPVRQLLALALFAFAGSGCRPAKPAPPASPPPAVAVVHPVVQKVQNYYEYNGYLEAIESVQVQARVEGMLTDILFQEGDEVEKGKRLYKIDNREYLSGVAKSEAEVASPKPTSRTPRSRSATRSPILNASPVWGMRLQRPNSKNLPVCSH